ncbi:hypothetical protein COLO4_20532 [Corchorus olitorius]|uniref:Uncharacterized protein n=1 Tax=Corchorus olitorius TaxID=93759 RepID=A0A1R3IZ96_9ROSI|nr:hypothetical protein COLO4_20532 [Corchorus olitorius]
MAATRSTANLRNLAMEATVSEGIPFCIKPNAWNPFINGQLSGCKHD